MSKSSRGSNAKASRARSGEKKIGSHPSASSNASRTFFGVRAVDRDRVTERSHHQLERLAQARRVGSGIRNLVLVAVELERLTAQRRTHDLDVLARLRQRLAPR